MSGFLKLKQVTPFGYVEHVGGPLEVEPKSTTPSAHDTSEDIHSMQERGGIPSPGKSTDSDWYPLSI